MKKILVSILVFSMILTSFSLNAFASGGYILPEDTIEEAQEPYQGFRVDYDAEDYDVFMHFILILFYLPSLTRRILSFLKEAECTSDIDLFSQFLCIPKAE